MFIKVGTICLQCLPAHASVRFFELTDDNSFVSSSEAREMTGDTAAAFVRNYSYKFIYCASLTFGTWMTADSNTPKITAYAVSLLWCLAIVGNQVDYVMKPWMEEDKEAKKQDMAFEQIIRFDFWTYSAACFLGCFFPLIGRKIEVREDDRSSAPRNFTRDAWRTAVVSVLVAGNLVPAFCSYRFLSVLKKADSAYNLLFQDVCKLGILTVDLQFAWFCWRLEDRFSRLNDRLQTMISSEEWVVDGRLKGRRRPVVTTTTTMDENHRYQIRRADVSCAVLMETVKTVNGVCEERVLTNVLCYMFNTICGLFDTISAYRTPGTPALSVIVHLLWVLNCAGRITLVCFAASSVVEQDDRLHDLALIAKEALGAKGNCWEMKRLSRRLAHCKVHFDVCGMVTVDKMLLASAVISVISYLVIVLQYNYS